MKFVGAHLAAGALNPHLGNTFLCKQHQHSPSSELDLRKSTTSASIDCLSLLIPYIPRPIEYTGLVIYGIFLRTRVNRILFS